MHAGNTSEFSGPIISYQLLLLWHLHGLCAFPLPGDLRSHSTRSRGLRKYKQSQLNTAMLPYNSMLYVL